MRTVSVPVFEFGELNESAKEAARSWWQTEQMDLSDWAPDTVNRLCDVAAAFGISVNELIFSGFAVQGDGAHFTGTYEYRDDWRKALNEQRAANEDLFLRLESFGEDLERIQSGHGYKLQARISSDGKHWHSGGADIEVFEGSLAGGEDADEKAAVAIRDSLRYLMVLMYGELEKAHDAFTTEESINDVLENGDFEFLENGKPYLG